MVLAADLLEATRTVEPDGSRAHARGLESTRTSSRLSRSMGSRRASASLFRHLDFADLIMGSSCQ